jgi:DNA-binding protein
MTVLAKNKPAQEFTFAVLNQLETRKTENVHIKLRDKLIEKCMKVSLSRIISQ